jgi:hypothetical protein
LKNGGFGIRDDLNPFAFIPFPLLADAVKGEKQFLT